LKSNKAVKNKCEKNVIFKSQKLKKLFLCFRIIKIFNKYSLVSVSSQRYFFTKFFEIKRVKASCKKYCLNSSFYHFLGITISKKLNDDILVKKIKKSFSEKILGIFRFAFFFSSKNNNVLFAYSYKFKKEELCFYLGFEENFYENNKMNKLPR
jgi:hypothetical protein